METNGDISCSLTYVMWFLIIFDNILFLIWWQKDVQFSHAFQFYFDIIEFDCIAKVLWSLGTVFFLNDLLSPLRGKSSGWTMYVILVGSYTIRIWFQCNLLITVVPFDSWKPLWLAVHVVFNRDWTFSLAIKQRIARFHQVLLMFS